MLGHIRSIFANSWVARIGAAVLAVSFGAWGIQGALFGQNSAGPGADDVATVDGEPITAASFSSAYQRQLAQSAAAIAQQNGTQADPSSLPADTRQAIADGVLRRLVTEAAIVATARKAGLTVPDATLRDAVFAIPLFKGPDGQFDRQRFNEVLAANHLTEPQVLSLMRDELLSRGLIEPVRAGAVVPPVLLRTLFAYGAETRAVDSVSVPFAAMATPAPPDEATLRRFYADHPSLFAVPEMRHIKAVVLSPDTVGRLIDVTEASIRAAYEAERAQVFKPERRSADIVTASTAADAAAIASFWRGGASWGQVKTFAAKHGAIAVALPDAAADEFPSAGLGRAVFAAPPDAVTGPISDEAGSVVLVVTHVVPPSGTFAAEHDRLRDRIAARQAADGMQDRVDRLSDAIAGGGLDKVPADLGAEPIEGSLDAAGNTPDGGPAPIPGPPALRDAIIKAAFAARQGAPANLEPGPDGGYFALTVDHVTPAHEQSFADAGAAVLRFWDESERRREANVEATGIYVAAKAARALGPAAAAAHLVVVTSRRFTREGGAAGLPPSLVPIAFSLGAGGATMVGTDNGFTVAVVTDAGHPTLAAAPDVADRLRSALAQSVGDDLEIAYAGWLTDHAPVRVNQANLRQVVGP